MITLAVKTAAVPSGGSLVVVGGDQKVVMETGDSVKVTSSAASSCDVIMEYIGDDLMGKSKDLATPKDSGLSIDGTLTTPASTGTNLTSNSYNVVKIQTDKDDNGSNDDAILQFTTGSSKHC